jgi:hypothetical protein
MPFESEDPEVELCDNGATDWPLCSECPDGSIPSEEFGCEGPEEECPEGQIKGPDGICISSTLEPEPEPEPEAEEEGGSGGGGGGGGLPSGMFSAGVGWSRQPFTAVQYRAPTRAIDVLNQFVENEIKSSLIQENQRKGLFS